MTIYASQQTQNFYFDSVHKDIPSDAVEISAELYEALLDGRSGGMDVDFSTSPPSLKERPVIELSVEQLAYMERLWRDSHVTETEWLVSRHRDEQDIQLSTSLTAEQFAALLSYRQVLRDWPQTEVFPDSAQRPVAPPWFAEQVQ
ncbi:phage tail assembly chaperone [Pseudomonas sp.]|uniref:phage tail assembly chaperone n=1 Tax=Pseudomonas sp. TaxID=306 RepID=UPI003BB22429